MNFDIIFKIGAVGIVTAIIGMILKKYGKEDLSIIVSVIGLIVALVIMLDMVAQLYDTITNLFDF
ncbi:MAG: stage III sporulation protein AC [Clostridia bacterium]|nr:stage III sporulation protein AC [Clostridia bacterium]